MKNWKKLNDAFETGLQHLKEVAELVSVEGLSAADLFTYYTRHISYRLDDRKRPVWSCICVTPLHCHCFDQQWVITSRAR